MFTHKIDEQVILRTFEENDAEAFYQLTIHSKEYLKEWLGWLDNIQTVEDTAENIQSRLNEVLENRGHPISFAIIYNGEIAGTIGFGRIDQRNRTGVIGYWLGEQFQGRGIMSKSIEFLIGYGFNELQLNRIEIHVASENEKSRAIPERYGFKKEGVIRQAEFLYDHYVDHVLYGLLVEDWK